MVEGTPSSARVGDPQSVVLDGLFVHEAVLPWPFWPTSTVVRGESVRSTAARFRKNAGYRAKNKQFAMRSYFLRN